MHGMCGNKRQMLEAGSVSRIAKRGGVDAEIFASQRSLDSNLPKAHGRHETVISRRRHQFARVLRKVWRIVEHPKEHVRVEQNSHLPRRPSNSASASSDSGASKSSG